MSVVGFGDVERDDAVVMTGHYAVALRIAFEELEFEAAFRVFLTRLHRQAQFREGVKQAALGGFDAIPVDAVLRRREIGNGARQLARTGVPRAYPGRVRERPSCRRFPPRSYVTADRRDLSQADAGCASGRRRFPRTR